MPLSHQTRNRPTQLEKQISTAEWSALQFYRPALSHMPFIFPLNHSLTHSCSLFIRPSAAHLLVLRVLGLLLSFSDDRIAQIFLKWVSGVLRACVFVCGRLVLAVFMQSFSRPPCGRRETDGFIFSHRL